MPSAIVVVTRKQLDQCLQIRKEVFVLEQGVPIEEEVDQYDESPEASTHVLLTDDSGEPIGTGRMKPFQGRTAKLQRIAVLPAARGLGIGSAIVAALEEAARSAGYTGTVLDAQTQAEAFYTRLGYQAVSREIIMDAGIPHIRMGKAWM